MEDGKKYLSEWITGFLKNRDVVFRTIDSIDKHEQYDLHVKHKTKEQYVLVEPGLSPDALERIEQDKHILMVCFNTKENFNFLMENWKQLALFQKLTIYFVNPLSEPDKKWIINPYVHNSICDSASLKLGLQAMFETVEPLTEEQIKSLIKQKF